MQGISGLCSVLEEKTNRISEVMMSSVRPGVLMGGKIFGAGSAAITQVGIWIAMMCLHDYTCESFFRSMLLTIKDL